MKCWGGRARLAILFLSLIGCAVGNYYYGSDGYGCDYPCRCGDYPYDPVCAENMRSFPNGCFYDMYNEYKADYGEYYERSHNGPCYRRGHPDYESQWPEDEFSNGYGPYQNYYQDVVEEETYDAYPAGSAYGGDDSYGYKNEEPSYGGYPSNNGYPSNYPSNNNGYNNYAMNNNYSSYNNTNTTSYFSSSTANATLIPTTLAPGNTTAAANETTVAPPTPSPV